MVDGFISSTVVVYWPEEEEWFEGVIFEEGVEDGNAGYIVTYEDGDTGFIDGVAGNPSVKVLKGPASDGSDLVPGAHVKCLFDEDEWYRGWIHERTSSGGFDVKFEDGDFREAVPLQEIQLFAAVPAPGSAAVAREETDATAAQTSPESDNDDDGGGGNSDDDAGAEENDEDDDGDAASDIALALAVDTPGGFDSGAGSAGGGFGTFDDTHMGSMDNNNNEDGGGAGSFGVLNDHSDLLQSPMSMSSAHTTGALLSPQRSSSSSAAAAAAAASAQSTVRSSRGDDGSTGGRRGSTTMGGGCSTSPDDDGGVGGAVGGSGGGGLFVPWDSPGPREVHPAFVPLSDSPALAMVLSLALEASSSNSSSSSSSSSLSPLFLQAEPGARLAELHLRAAALEQKRWDREMCGAAWEGSEASPTGRSGKGARGKSGSKAAAAAAAAGDAGLVAPGASDTAWRAMDMKVLRRCLKPAACTVEVGGGEAKSGGSGGGSSSSNDSDCGAGAGAALWEALLQVRMRAIALVKLHHGHAPSLPLVQASVELARCYAMQGLWVQAHSHAGRAVGLLQEVEEQGGEDGCVLSTSTSSSAFAVPVPLVAGGGLVGSFDHSPNNNNKAAAPPPSSSLAVPRAPPTGASLDSPGVQKVAAGVLAVFDALRSCASECQGRVPWDNLVGMVGEDDQGHPLTSPTTAAAAGGAGAGGVGGGDDLYAVKLSTPYGTRQNLPPQHVLAAAKTPEEAFRLSTQGAPHSGIPRFDPHGRAPSSTRTTTHNGNSSNLGSRVSTKFTSSATQQQQQQHHQQQQQQKAEESLRRSMTWGEAVAFLRTQHPGFKRMAATLEASVRQDHLALLSLAFLSSCPAAAAANVASVTNSSSGGGGGEKEAQSAAAAAAVPVVPAAGGSVVVPSALAAALEKTPSFSREFGQRGCAKMTELLCERISSVTVKISGSGGSSSSSSSNEGHGDESNELEEEEQGVGLPVTWEEVLAVFALAVAEATASEADDNAQAEKENADEGEEGSGGGGDDDGANSSQQGSDSGFALGGLTGSLGHGLGAGGGRRSGTPGGGGSKRGGGGGGGGRYKAAWVARLRCDLLLLEGQGFSATGRLQEAEQSLGRLQRLLGECGWQDSLGSCEAYTCMAELCVVRHIGFRAERQKLAAEGAEEWLASDQGHGLWRREVKRLLQETRQQQAQAQQQRAVNLAAEQAAAGVAGVDVGMAGGLMAGMASGLEQGKSRLTRVELEYRVRQALLKAHADKLLGTSSSEGGGGDGGIGLSSQHFDRAEEFLLRVWEIHESTLGRTHPGTAAACLSLGNLCVINRDLAQSKLWFESAVAILDACFGPAEVTTTTTNGGAGSGESSSSSSCTVAVTAATEAQLGQVLAKLGKGARVAAPHLERAATFYLAKAKQALSAERKAISSSSAATTGGGAAGCVGAGGSPPSGHLRSSAELAASSRRRVWLAKRSHGLWTSLGLLWLEESRKSQAGGTGAGAVGVAAADAPMSKNNSSSNSNKASRERDFAARASCRSFEKALSSVGAMHDRGGEASSEGLRLLLASLKQFGEALEQAGNWRRAGDAYGQLRTLAARLLGQGHKTTKQAAAKARRAGAKAANQPHLPASDSGGSAPAAAAVQADSSSPSFKHRATMQSRGEMSPLSSPAGVIGAAGGGGVAKSPKGFSGMEDWLN